jgi:hypothetical protein
MEGKDNVRDILRMAREGRSMFRRLTRLHVGVIAGAAITMGMILVPTSGVASAAQTAPRSATVPSAGLTELIGNLVDNGNGWYLDGRENCCGGVHMAPPGSDGGTQEWDVYYNSDTDTYTFVDQGNGWCLDGRENGVGGVHMAPCGSDPATQQWYFVSDGLHVYLVDVGNNWALDGRENCCGGVHMAPLGSDPGTQSWNLVHLQG